MKSFFEKNRNLSLLCIISLLSLLTFVKSDLPVHCKKEQISGDWVFRIEKVVFNPKLLDEKTTCGHGYPDRIETTVGDVDFSFDSFEDVEVHLNSDYSVSDSNGKKVGTWTTIYDEAFVVNFGDKIYTAFLKYYKNPNNQGEYLSNCEKTMIGWFQADKNEPSKNWSCFLGFRKQLLANFQKNAVKSFLALNEKYTMSTEFKSKALYNEHNNKNSILGELKYGEQKDVVEELNSLNLPWKAEITDEFRDYSFFELKEKLGMRRAQSAKKELESFSFKEHDDVNPFEADFTRNVNHNINTQLNQRVSVIGDPENKTQNVEVDKDSKDVTDFAEISKYIDLEIKDIDQNKLPKNWDWRNVGGRSFIPPLSRQNDCGSCYTFAIMSSLESRLRIKTNLQDQTLFSKQFPISCSFYTEGCDGGYPFLVAKFLNEFEIVPEQYFRYESRTSDCRKVGTEYQKNPKMYKVSRYEYLGGFYGATSEADMVKELRARGPIPGNMSVPWSFSYYKSGIYSESQLIKNAGSLKNITMLDRNLSWSKVDHSILLVGYGEENGIKYWIGMNTWGENWGEGGYFRVLRGENEVNIETMGDAARIEVVDRHSQK